MHVTYYIFLFIANWQFIYYFENKQTTTDLCIKRIMRAWSKHKENIQIRLSI